MKRLVINNGCDDNDEIAEIIYNYDIMYHTETYYNKDIIKTGAISIKIDKYLTFPSDIFRHNTGVFI